LRQFKKGDQLAKGRTYHRKNSGCPELQETGREAEAGGKLVKSEKGKGTRKVYSHGLIRQAPGRGKGRGLSADRRHVDQGRTEGFITEESTQSIQLLHESIQTKGKSTL